MKNLIAVLFITFFSVVYSQGQNLTAFKINNISFDGDQFLGYDPFGFYYTTKNNIFSKILHLAEVYFERKYKKTNSKRSNYYVYIVYLLFFMVVSVRLRIGKQKD